MNATKMPVEALWKKFLKSRDDRYRNALVEKYAALVHIQAARLSRKLPAQISYDEICSAGYDGLIEAVEVDDHPEVTSVQWHPEDTAPNDPAQQQIFDALVSRAAATRS